MRTFLFSILIILFHCVCVFAQSENDEKLLEATRKGDLQQVKTLLAAGADVDARARYQVTPLFFAADRGNVEIIRVLLEHGADVDARDTFYKTSPVRWASYNNHPGVVRELLKHGAKGAQELLQSAISEDNAEMVQAIVDGAPADSLQLAEALLLAEQAGNSKSAEALKTLGARLPSGAKLLVENDLLQLYAGDFHNAERSMKLRLYGENQRMKGVFGDQDPITYVPGDSAHRVNAVEFSGLTLTFAVTDGQVESVTVRRGDWNVHMVRGELPVAEEPVEAVESDSSDAGLLRSGSELVHEAINWPSFRGNYASGNADGQYPPVQWDGESGENIRWKLPIPGFAHSSPVIWGDQLFITSAVSSDTGAVLRVGLYGDVKPDADISEHIWKVYAVDRKSGKILWEREAHRGVPQVKRHTKASQANSTAVTDGQFVVALFGAEGLYCYDLQGNLQWQKNLGYLDSGWFYDPDYQWGHGSSPIIYQDMVIVQCDIQKGSFIAAYRLADGTEAWKTDRDEIPSWATPAVYSGPTGDELITNGTRAIRGYDPANGNQLWSLTGNSEIAVPTPLLAHGLIYVTNGYRPIQPIYAIRPGSRGDISLQDDAQSNEQIAWSKDRGGPYMPTPVIYGNHLYVCANNGTMTVYDARTGEQAYRHRLGGRGSGYAFTASPLAADGKVYFFSEDGETYIVRAGDEYRQLAVSRIGEVIMATPAMTDGMLYIRAQSHLYGIGE